MTDIAPLPRVWYLARMLCAWSRKLVSWAIGQRQSAEFVLAA